MGLSTRFPGLPDAFQSVSRASQITFGTLLGPTWCPRGSSERFWDDFGAMLPPFSSIFRTVFGRVSAFVFPCVFKLFSARLFVELPSLLASARKWPTCEIRHTLQVKTCFFKVRARAGAASKTKKSSSKKLTTVFQKAEKIVQIGYIFNFSVLQGAPAKMASKIASSSLPGKPK